MRIRAALIAATVVAGVIVLFGSVYWGAREQMIPSSLALLDTLTGQRRDVIETLTNPVDTKGWTERGIVLTDGRTIPLPDASR